MTTSRRLPKLPDTIKDERPEARLLMQQILQLDQQIEAAEALRDEKHAKLTEAARSLRVTWADLGRLTGTTPENVMARVQRYERDHPQD